MISEQGWSKPKVFFNLNFLLCKGIYNYVGLEVLHWLPIRHRIEYKVASLVWRCQLGLAPTYLIDLCRPVSGSRSSRSLRSSERGLLLVPYVRPYHYHAEPC